MSSLASAPASRSLTAAWERWWFAPTSLQRLGAFRILILVVALWDVVGYAHLVLPETAAVSASGVPLSWHPILAFEILGLQPIGVDTARIVLAVLLTAIALGIVGLGARAACLVVAVLAFYWSGLAYSFEKPHHDKIALTFALLALPLAPVGARLSLDHWLRRRRRVGDDPDLREGAGLPLRLTQVTIAIGYCVAGSSKLWLGGLEWMNGYSLQGIMMGHVNAWAPFFAANHVACQIMSIGLVLSQLTFPLVLVLPRLRWFYLPVLISMHLITWKTMDTGPYFALWGTFVCFLPLEKVPATVRAWTTTGPLLRRTAIVAALVTGLALVIAVLLVQLPAWVVAGLLGSGTVGALLARRTDRR